MPNCSFAILVCFGLQCAVSVMDRPLISIPTLDFGLCFIEESVEFGPLPAAAGKVIHGAAVDVKQSKEHDEYTFPWW